MSGLSFHESMRGELVDRGGQTQAIEFHLKAEASSLARFCWDGRARLTGILRLPGEDWEGPATGTLELLPLRRRRLSYRLDFEDSDQRMLTLRGTKTLRAGRPLRSLTAMPTTLHHGATRLASGTLHFDLHQLPDFARSWSLSSSFSRQGVGVPVGSRLSGAELSLLRDFADALITQTPTVPAADDQTITATLARLDELPPVLTQSWRALLHGLDAAALVRHRRPFSSLSPEQRRALVSRLSTTPTTSAGVGAAMVAALGLPVKLAHFGRRDYLDAVGMPDPPPPPPEPAPRYFSGVQAPEQLDAETTLDADVVVIGSGAGGAAVAALLAEGGRSVVVIEEGRYARRSDFSGPATQRMQRFWHAGGLNLVVGNVPLVVPTGRLVGGTTAINSGTCYPTPGPVLDHWRVDLGLGQDFGRDAFAPHLDAVQRFLQVGPGDASCLGDIAAVVAAGADAMGGQHGPLPRNAPGCDGQGACAFGCPSGAKQSTDVSYMPRALRAGAVVLTGLPVTQILMRDRRAVGVEVRGTDRHGVAREVVVQARVVVVAAGSLRSPLLLHSSGIRLPWLGRGLSLHPAMGMLARGAVIDQPWSAIPQSYGVEGLLGGKLDGRVRFEGLWTPPPLTALTLPLVGPELSDWMGDAAHIGQYGFMVRDRGVGRVHRGPHGEPIIHYNLQDDSLRDLKLASATLAELLLRGGAAQVSTGIGPVGIIDSVDRARGIAGLDLRPRDFQLLAFHPLGSCRMGRDADSGVVDRHHRVFGTADLYVVDGSSVPTSLGVNPQITIMAMAERAAQGIAAGLDGRPPS